MRPITPVECDIIETRVNSIYGKIKDPLGSRGFLKTILEQFFPGRDADIPEMITDGGGDMGVDAIGIVEGEDSAEIFLFQTKYRNSKATLAKTINEPEAIKATTFIDLLLNKSDVLKKKSSFRLRELVQRIWDLHEAGLICKYRFVFATNGGGLNMAARSLLQEKQSQVSSLTIEEYLARDLIRDIVQLSKGNETGSLKSIGKDIIERIDGDIRGAIASIDAGSFIDLIKSNDCKSIKRNLFDENLRIFLGANSGYNSAIIETAGSTDNHLFWYLNNGITITCENYTFNKGHYNPTIKLVNFQIVNGAQTSHSLMEVYRTSPEKLKDVVLLVRIYATERADIVERVAVATNSQARIQSRDLRANHAVLKRIETAFEGHEYFFERKRNMYLDQPHTKRIDALRLGQIILSFYLDEPDRAKTASDAIFDERFKQIFHDHLNVAELIKVYNLHLIIDELRDHPPNMLTDTAYSTLNSDFLIYGHWFILYAASLINRSKKQNVPTGESARQLIYDAINLVTRACRGVKLSHYQTFRSSKTKQRILDELDGGQLRLFADDS